MHNIWNSFEIDMLARDLSYVDYLYHWTKSEQVHKAVSEEGYAELKTFFSNELKRDIEAASVERFDRYNPFL
jgi:hypothetical protein